MYTYMYIYKMRIWKFFKVEMGEWKMPATIVNC